MTQLSAAPRHNVPRHILLVEDEPGTITTVALLLEMSGYKVTQAMNGLRALERLDVELPDVIVTDYMMPHLDGVGLIKAIRDSARTSRLPVILTSAALPPEVRPSEVAQGFIAKPYQIESLIALIEKVAAG